MYPISLQEIGEDECHRISFAQYATERIRALKGSGHRESLYKILSRHVHMGQEDGNDNDCSSSEDGNRDSAYLFTKKTVDAFFDNDLLQTVKIFMEHASGSFGL